MKTFPTTSILWHKVWLYVRKVKTERPQSFRLQQNGCYQHSVEKFGFQPYPQKHWIGSRKFTKAIGCMRDLALMFVRCSFQVSS